MRACPGFCEFLFDNDLEFFLSKIKHLKFLNNFYFENKFVND